MRGRWGGGGRVRDEGTTLTKDTINSYICITIYTARFPSRSLWPPHDSWLYVRTGLLVLLDDPDNVPCLDRELILTSGMVVCNHYELLK